MYWQPDCKIRMFVYVNCQVPDPTFKVLYTRQGGILR